MRTLNLTQGDPAWHTHRANARNASDAPAVLGCSPYMTRAELLRVRHTGIVAEVPPELERRFAAGHAIEAAQREPAAAIIGEPLYPVVGVEVVDGLELSASFDGITMSEDACYECKTLNDDLRAALVAVGGIDANDGRNLPKHYRVQMEQQLAVSGAERVLFVAADRNGDDVRRCWYYPDSALRAEILAGWRQFDADLAAYVPPEVVEPIQIVARRPDQLPSLRSSVRGELMLESNIKEWEAAALAYIKSVRDHELKTDDDFTNADAAAKWCDASKLTLQGVRAQLMSATGDVNTAVATLDRIMGELDGTRIAFTNAIKARKETRKTEIVTAAARALKEHVATLDDRLRPIFSRVGVNYMPPSAAVADFAGAIRGKSSLAKMQEAVDALLAKAKGAATATAADITLNLTALRELPPEQQALFADTATLVLKAPDDCRAQITSRIAEHRAAEERRLEAERARIRAEEEARAAEKLRQEQEAREAEERRQRAAAEEEQRRQLAEKEAATRSAPEPRLLPAAMDPDRLDVFGDPEPMRPPAAGPAVIPLPTRAPAAPAGPPTLRLGQISERLGFVVTTDFLASLGFPMVAQDKAAKLWHEHQFHGICAAIAQHVVAVANGQKVAA